MGYLDKIGSLPPIPPELPRAQRLPQRKRREDQPSSPTVKQPHEHDPDDEGRPHIDEYA